MSTAAGARAEDARPTAGAGPGLRDAQSLGKGRGRVSGSGETPGWDAEPRELRWHRAGRRGGGESWQEVWKDLQGAAASAGQPGVVIYPSSFKSSGPSLSLTEVGKHCKVHPFQWSWGRTEPCLAQSKRAPLCWAEVLHVGHRRCKNEAMAQCDTLDQ